MGAFIPFILGAIVGGFVKWQFSRRQKAQDEAAWRNKLASAKTQIQNLTIEQAEKENLATALASAHTKLNELEAAQNEATELNKKLIEAEAQIVMLETAQKEAITLREQLGTAKSQIRELKIQQAQAETLSNEKLATAEAQVKELDLKKKEVQDLQGRLMAAENLITDLGQKQQEAETLRERLALAEAKIEQFRPYSNEMTASGLEAVNGPSVDGPSDNYTATAEKDDAARADKLEKIKGIGPVFASRLNEAGILTFSDVAKLTPRQLQEIISPNSSNMVNSEDLIRQAQDLSQ